MRRIIYIQFTNPAGYPPLEHSSRILASAGWEVQFLGAYAFGADTLKLPIHRSVQSRTLPGFCRKYPKISYPAYIAWATAACLGQRPSWIYASDPLSCPAALTARALCGAKIIYHEHDTPRLGAQSSRFLRLIHRAREMLAQSADICILPQKERMQSFLAEIDRRGRSICVWNCPRLEEVSGPREPIDPSVGVTFYYHGSLNPERLPFGVVRALSSIGSKARLIVVGYETVGSIGYVRELMRLATEAGIADRIDYRGPIEQRASMLAIASEADVGLAFMPNFTEDPNMRYMVGASNKPFDYLAVGQMLLVSNLPDWREWFVQSGYAYACNPSDEAELSAAMKWCAEHPEAVRAAGEAGRQRIRSEWNYEKCFAPVLSHLVL